MIRHAKTGHASTTDASGCYQEILQVKIGEAVVPGGINGASVDVLVVGVRDPGVVASRRRTALVVRGRSPERRRGGGGVADRRHAKSVVGSAVKLSNQAGLIGEITANPLLLI